MKRYWLIFIFVLAFLVWLGYFFGLVVNKHLNDNEIAIFIGLTSFTVLVLILIIYELIKNQ